MLAEFSFFERYMNRIDSQRKYGEYICPKQGFVKTSTVLSFVSQDI